MPWTSTPFAASGSATRPVPMPSSSTRPPAASSASSSHSRRIRLLVPLVVDVGDALAVGCGPVVIHRAIAARLDRPAPSNKRASEDACRSMPRSRPPTSARCRPPRPPSKRRATTASSRFEGQHDPFFPLLLAAEHTERVQLTTAVAIAFARNPMTLAQTAYDLQLASHGPLPSRPRHADQAAHREAVLDAVVAARRSHARVRARHPRDLGHLAHGRAARLRGRVLPAHVDDAVLQSRARAPTACPSDLPRRRRPAHDRDGRRGRRRFHRASVRHRAVAARADDPRGRARRGSRWSFARRRGDRVPAHGRGGRHRRAVASAGARRCGPGSRSTARRPPTR